MNDGVTIERATDPGRRFGTSSRSASGRMFAQRAAQRWTASAALALAVRARSGMMSR